jgi:hypothetical protein
LKKAGKEDAGKKVMKEVIEMQLRLNAENEKKKAEDEAEKAVDAQPGQETVVSQAVAAS